MKRRESSNQFILIVVFVLFLVILFRTAWISQRAYLNFRVMENWVHGYGLGFNVGERVLPVSQPLWLLLVGSAYWFALSVFQLSDLNLLYYLSISLSIFISLLTIGYLLRTISGSSAKAVVVSGLLLSKAFIDFSTSGLENPLIHLLLLLFLTAYVRLAELPRRRPIRGLVFLSLFGSLIVALHWELFLLIGFGIFHIGLQLRREIRVWAYMITALLPLGFYLLLSTLLYGSPLPNMYVARFHAGVGWGRLVRQGIMYLLNIIDFDPVSVILIALGILAVLLYRARSFYPFVLGIVATIALTVLMGGDSLSGRLFSPLVFISALLVSRVDLDLSKLGQAALLMVMAIGIVGERSPLRSDLSYEYQEPDHRGIIDERGAVYQETGLLGLNRDSIYPPGSDWAGADWHFREYRDVIILDERRLGFAAYQVGPESYVLAATGITDPLLARLPTVDPVVWDLFSLERKIPKNFDAVVVGDPHDLACEGFADYYSDLRAVVSRPLFKTGHLSALWRTISQKPSRSVFETCQ